MHILNLCLARRRLGDFYPDALALDLRSDAKEVVEILDLPRIALDVRIVNSLQYA